MGWILMQPDDSANSVAALADLRAGLPCDFDSSLSGPVFAQWPLAHVYVPPLNLVIIP